MCIYFAFASYETGTFKIVFRARKVIVEIKCSHRLCSNYARALRDTKTQKRWSVISLITNRPTVKNLFKINQTWKKNSCLNIRK